MKDLARDFVCSGTVASGTSNFRVSLRQRLQRFLSERGAQVQNGSDVLVVVPAISDIGGRVQVSLYFQRDTFPAVLPEGGAV